MGTRLNLSATALCWFYVNGIKLWLSVRQLSGDDGYERYLEHHAAAHPGIIPLSRSNWFTNRLQQKWSGVSRCC